MSRPTPEALAKIAKRSMCPTCDGREPGPDEQAYASCVFCASGIDMPESLAPVVALPRRSTSAPRTQSA